MRLSCSYIGSLAAAFLLFSSFAAADAPRFKRSLDLSLEGRAYAGDPPFEGQAGSGISLSAKPEFDYAFSGAANLRFVPFGRWDQHDDERSHADIRELSLRIRQGNFDLVAGISRVFWGVTESVHLIDIVNQTDLVENPDGEDKLGQPMLQLVHSSARGKLSGFVLPWFRERSLPGREGRLRAELPYNEEDARYEAGAGDKHVDAALRYTFSHGGIDFGLSHFNGTARDPRFVLDLTGAGPVLTPFYDLIERNGLDLSWLSGAWLWKLEVASQHASPDDYAAAAGGFEFTGYGVLGSGWDAGLLAELLWDERGAGGPSPFQNDLFLGTRWSGNDVAGTELLAGIVVDLDHQGYFSSIEASRRIGNDGKLAVELRLFGGGDAQDPLQSLEKDDYLQLEYTLYW